MLEGKISFLGTDKLGRDALSRIALAAQASIAIEICAVMISMFVGVMLDLIAGYSRAWTESLIMGLADLQLSIPRVLLLIPVTAIGWATVGPRHPRPRA